MMEISTNKLRELARLKQKKQRLAEGRVIVEGERTLRQMRDYGVVPLEQYVGAGREPIWPGKPVWELRPDQFERICDSEHPAQIAALFTLPVERESSIQTAFYLDGISDPGNLGSVFRVAAAMGIGAILLSPDCVEISSPKVIRASLGSVYQIPFRKIAPARLTELKARIVVTVMYRGVGLKEASFAEGERLIVVMGSEARGVSGELLDIANEAWHIEMTGGMESLNVAVAAGIIAYRLQGR